MNLYRISQNENCDYDTYDSAVVAAVSEEAAQRIVPGGENEDEYWADPEFGQWAHTLEKVRVEYLGKAKPGTKAGVICASYNAG